ncbi:MAG: pro-sigmaK processing inhibitor BofA family protein [Lachnospiraceae bacterium]|nr:pro-sigmaK processing inhibitor BofA family protein [Lachnospiraceae bacterium]
MNQISGVWMIGAVCIIVLLIVAFRTKVELIINFVLRSVLGTIAIYFINGFLGWTGLSVMIGINPLTVLTSGILGFPGVALLFGIEFYKLL